MSLSTESEGSLGTDCTRAPLNNRLTAFNGYRGFLGTHTVAFCCDDDLFLCSKQIQRFFDRRLKYRSSVYPDLTVTTNPLVKFLPKEATFFERVINRSLQTFTLQLRVRKILAV